MVIFFGFISIPISVCFFGLGEKEMEDTIEIVNNMEQKGYTELPERLIGKNLTDKKEQMMALPAKN